MSKRESVLAAIATLLTDLASGRVYRSRREQLPDLPCIVIEPESESTLEGPIGRINATLTVAISVFYQGDIPDQSGDTLSARLSNASNRALGSVLAIAASRPKLASISVSISRILI